MKILGADLALTLHDIELSDYDRGDLLMRLRVLSSVESEIAAEARTKAKAKAAARGGGR